MTLTTITRKFEFDSGHRIPHHQGKCRHLHGHRYTLEITLAGKVNSVEGLSHQGMLIDFSQIKQQVQTHLLDEWDHAFFVYQHDDAVKNFLQSLPEHKTVILEHIPTVENLAAAAFQKLNRIFSEDKHHHLRLLKVRLFETPNCWAEVSSEDF